MPRRKILPEKISIFADAFADGTPKFHVSRTLEKAYHPDLPDDTRITSMIELNTDVLDIKRLKEILSARFRDRGIATAIFHRLDPSHDADYRGTVRIYAQPADISRVKNELTSPLVGEELFSHLCGLGIADVRTLSEETAKLVLRFYNESALLGKIGTHTMMSVSAPEEVCVLKNGELTINGSLIARYLADEHGEDVDFVIACGRGRSTPPNSPALYFMVPNERRDAVVSHLQVLKENTIAAPKARVC